MKTLRDLLLSRHEDTNPKLDALRRRVVAEHVVPAEDGDEAYGTMATRLWRELFLSCRWTRLMTPNRVTHLRRIPQT